MQCVWEKPQAWVEFEQDYGERPGPAPYGKITERTIIHPRHLDTLQKIRNNGRCLTCFCKGHVDRNCPDIDRREEHRREEHRKCTSCHQKGHRSFDCLYHPLSRGDASMKLKQFWARESATDTAEVVTRRTEGRTRLLKERGFSDMLGKREPGPLWDELDEKFPGVLRRGAVVVGGHGPATQEGRGAGSAGVTDQKNPYLRIDKKTCPFSGLGSIKTLF